MLHWLKGEVHWSSQRRYDGIQITQETILTALRQVIDPELGQNLVDLGMVREGHVAEGQVEVAPALTTLACPLKDRLAAQQAPC